MIKSKRSSLSFIVLAALFLAVLAACLCTIIRWQQTIKANDEVLESLSEEKSSLSEEIEEYSYKNGMSKEDFVEEEAREQGYVYPGESAYYNVGPGA